MDTLDLLKVYGPLSLGWVMALYLLRFILERLEKDIQSRTDLAIALNSLTEIIKESKR